MLIYEMDILKLHVEISKGETICSFLSDRGRCINHQRYFIKIASFYSTHSKSLIISIELVFFYLVHKHYILHKILNDLYGND